MSSLAGRPGSVLWLLGAELRLYWRRGRMGPKSGLIMLGIILAVWLVMSFFLFRAIGPAIPPPPLGHEPIHGLVLAGVSVAAGFIASIMVSQAILGAVETIYTRNDLDLLLSSPLSPWTVLIVRCAAIAIGALPLYAGLLGVPVFWMAVFSSPLWLAALPALAALAFAATGIAVLIVTLLFRLIGPKRTRILAQILSAITGAAVFLSVQYFNITSRQTSAMTREQAVAWFSRLHIDPDAWWLTPARAMTGDIPALLIWLALCGALFTGGVFLFSRRFVEDAAAASSMGRRKRVSDTRIAAVRGGQTASIVRKELRLLWRDPVLLSQIGLQLVYLIPLALVLLRPDNHGGSSLTLQALAPALTLLSSALAGSLIWITVSAEDAPDLVASAPIPPAMIERGKIVAALAPVAALMVVPLAILLVEAPAVGAWALAGCFAAALTSALIGLWRRTPGSRRDFFRRRAQGTLMSRLGQTIVTLMLTSTVGFGVYGYPWLAIIPAIFTLAITGALHKPRDQRALAGSRR
jgi:ABC-2 type transport system permease protein